MFEGPFWKLILKVRQFTNIICRGCSILFVSTKCRKQMSIWYRLKILGKRGIHFHFRCKCEILLVYLLVYLFCQPTSGLLAGVALLWGLLSNVEGIITCSQENNNVCLILCQFLGYISTWYPNTYKCQRLNLEQIISKSFYFDFLIQCVNKLLTLIIFELFRLFFS